MIVEDRYYLFDWDTGLPYQVSKEYYESYNEWMNKMHEVVKIGHNSLGKVIITGTVGEWSADGLEDMFVKPDDYNFVDIKEDAPVNWFFPKYGEDNNEHEEGCP